MKYKPKVDKKLHNRQRNRKRKRTVIKDYPKIDKKVT